MIYHKKLENIREVLGAIGHDLREISEACLKIKDMLEELKPIEEEKPINEEEISKKVEKPLEEPEKGGIKEVVIASEEEPEVIHFAEEEIIEEPKCENKPVEPAKTLERPKYRQPEKEAPRKRVFGFRIKGER